MEQLMDNIYKSVVEALIFSSDDPIPSQEIIKAIQEIDGPDTQINLTDIDETVNILNDDYSKDDKAFLIVRIANGYTFATKPEYAKYVGYLSKLYLLLRINNPLQSLRLSQFVV